MTDEEFKKSKNELDKLKIKKEQIKINEDKLKVLKANGLENKSLTIVYLSSLAYFILFLISMVLNNTLASIFPWAIYPTVLIGTSICVGAIGKNLIYKKYKIEDRLKSFTNARTEAEKIEEAVLSQIEIDKLNNKNKVIDEAIEALTKEKETINKISGKYNISDKTTYSNEEVKNNIDKLSETIKKQYNELDELSTNKVLCEKFLTVEEKLERRMRTMMVAMITGVTTAAMSLPPLLLVKDTIQSASILTSLMLSLTPMITGIIGGSAYMLKRNSDQKKAFKSLKKKLNLKEENLNKNIENKEELEEAIEKQIKNISLNEIELQENMRYLDNEPTQSKKDISDKPKYVNYDYIDEILEEIKEDKGPTLVKRKILNQNYKK